MWIVYAFASLLFLNFRNVITKYNVASTHEYISMWYTFVLQIPLGILAVSTTGLEIGESRFFVMVLLRVILDIIAFMFFFKALKVARISSVLPFMSLLPAITTFTAYVINGQALEPVRLLLILAIVFCCYTLYRLNSTATDHNSNENSGIVYILIVILLYAILDPLHAEIIEISAPFTYFFISSLYFLVIWTTFLLIGYRQQLLASLSNRQAIVNNGINGIVLSLEVISLFSALVPGSITAIVTAIRSTNVAVSSLIGGVLFRESLTLTKIGLIIVIAVLILLLIAS